MSKRRLPLIAALVAFLFYALTLCRGISPGGLSLAAQVAGWDWQGMAGRPALWLVTLPLRVFPAGWIPVCLNLFSAACAAATIAALVKSVQLLAADSSRRHSSSSSSRLPVFLACAACGLEYSFWRDATAASGDMVGVLMLAAMIWCFLEFLESRRIFWAGAAAFMWGLKVGENWVVVLTLPLCFTAIVWKLKVDVINRKLWTAIIGMTLAGLAVYPLQAFCGGALPGTALTPGESFRLAFESSRREFNVYHFVFWGAHRTVTLAVMAFYFVPVLACLINKPGRPKSGSKDADRFQVQVFYAAQALMLVVCAWLALEPAFGPRQIIFNHIGAYIPLLNLDFVDALGIGALSASLLQRFAGSSRKRSRRGGETNSTVRTGVAAVFVALLVALGGGLLLKNLHPILLANSHPLSDYGRMAVESLPEGTGGVIISDDPRKLVVLQASLANWKDGAKWAAVDSASLPLEAYRVFLERKAPWGWLEDETRHALKPYEAVRLLKKISGGHRIFYLHPSFGYYFESFYLEPRGVIHEMKPLDQAVSTLPELPGPLVLENEKAWSLAWSNSLSTLAATGKGESSLDKMRQEILQTLRLADPPRQQELMLQTWNSVALDGWGVELQQNGHLQEAHERFEQALSLNTNNFSAQINLGCNSNLVAGRAMDLGGIAVISNWVGGDLERFGLTMRNNGPYDHPVCCYLLGRLYQDNMLPRQAIQSYARASVLAPGVLAPKYSLAGLYVQAGMPDQALELAANLRSSIGNSPEVAEIDAGISFIEADAWASKTNLPNARLALQSVAEKYPGNSGLINSVVQHYLNYGDPTNAAPLARQQVEKYPDNPVALMNQAAVLSGLGDASAAIPLLDHVLSITNMPLARLNRARANLQLTNLTKAEEDFNWVAGLEPKSWPANYGLAQIAVKRGDTNQAVARLRFCLSNSPPDSQANLLAQKLMAEINPGAGKTVKAQ
jgi:tetratricopeptide (TPR) repeat protein